MSSRLLPLIFLSILLDIYVFNSLQQIFEEGIRYRVFQLLFFLLIVLSYYSFHKVGQKIKDRSLFHGAGVNFHIGFLISSLVTKLIYGFCMALYDLVRLGFAIINLGEGFDLTERLDIVIMVIALLSLLVFVVMIYGVTWGRSNYKLERLNLKFSDLPKPFDGLKIVQISDIHAGSYDNNRGLLKGINLINREQPDLILFTGDLVNDHKDEVNPYIDSIKKLKSKYGTFAVLGNHDYYGAYRQSDKEGYWRDFFTKYEEMEFVLLNNQSKKIERGGSTIRIVGVENWGNANWTPKRGDLDVALEGVRPDEFCILLTHDPSHWDHKVLAHPKKVHLSFAGHTHGFQFGINLPFFKWSPAKYRYPRWMGLYKEDSKYLYVNRGFGYLAYPGRVGMRPEITIMTLNCLDQ